MKPILTIHTATYNRAYILEKAYRSLQKQTEMNFEWLITDDGSTDGTEELVDGWIKEQNPFNIRYIKLEHQGLIRAVNYAILLQMVSTISGWTRMTICVMMQLSKLSKD